MTNYTRGVVTWVPLEHVRVSRRRLRGTGTPTVELYRQWLEQGRRAPPRRLVRHGDWFLVRDGRHRVAAAIAAGNAGIEAVLQGRVVITSPATVIARIARAAAVGRRSSSPTRRVGHQLWGRSSEGRAPR